MKEEKHNHLHLEDMHQLHKHLGIFTINKNDKQQADPHQINPKYHNNARELRDAATSHIDTRYLKSLVMHRLE